MRFIENIFINVHSIGNIFLFQCEMNILRRKEDSLEKKNYGKILKSNNERKMRCERSPNGICAFSLVLHLSLQSFQLKNTLPVRKLVLPFGM